MVIPVGIKATTQGIELNFTDELDAKSVADTAHYTVKTWDLLRSRKYGSKHYNEQTLTVTKAKLGKDKKNRSDCTSLRSNQPGGWKSNTESRMTEERMWPDQFRIRFINWGKVGKDKPEIPPKDFLLDNWAKALNI